MDYAKLYRECKEITVLIGMALACDNDTEAKNKIIAALALEIAKLKQTVA